MANKKFGLGKGLEALIPEQNTNSQNENSDKVIKIPINLIRPNPNQPRTIFDSDELASLSNSIKQYGVIQPIIVRKEGEVYSIIAGERRWRAAQNAKISEIPSIVVEIDDAKILEVSLIENIQRQDLNPIEEANAYKRLIEELNLTQEEVSAKVGKSRVAISNFMRLLKLDKRVQEYLTSKLISEGHGRVLLQLEDKDKQFKLAQIIIDEELSVRQTESLVKKIKNSKEQTENINSKTKNINPYYLDIKNKLEHHFGTKVSLDSNKNKGKIQIEYYSEEDLQRILDILNLN